MKKRIFLVVICIALLSLGAYAYWHNKTSEEPEPGEEGGDEPDYPLDYGTGNNGSNANPLQTANFKLSEFACHDGTPVPETYYGNVSVLMRNLQVLRGYIGRPIFISSGYRTPSWNAKQPGAVANSFHTKAMAADIKVMGMSPTEVKAAIEELIATGKMLQGGVGLYPTFVHYDVRGRKARW